MDLDLIAISDFKELFFRDFPYLPIWDSEETYNEDDEVFYNKLFYRCLNNGVSSIPTTITDWELYKDSINNYVLDADITKAFNEAKISFNKSLFGDDNTIKTAYLYLTAHFLVNDIKSANQGLNSTGDFNVASRSVGSVSESYSIPQEWVNSSVLNFYTKSAYGLKYLAILMPRIKGNVMSVRGATIA